MQTNPTDQELIDDIRAGGRPRENAWMYIANHWGEYCCRTAIQRTQCTREEAKQAFSIAVVGVDKRIRSTEGYAFLGVASLKTYLTASTIYAALDLVRKRTGYAPLIQDEAAGEDAGKWFGRESCREVMDKALSGIGERCKKILLMFYNGFSMKEIAESFGFSSEETARKEKYKCQEKFKQYLIENPAVRTQLEINCYG